MPESTSRRAFDEERVSSSESCSRSRQDFGLNDPTRQTRQPNSELLEVVGQSFGVSL
jgi:hypothetical protein